jgi:preprotein translocase subunit SecD
MAALMFLTACGSENPSRETTVQIERMKTALELQVVDSDSDYMRRVFVHVGSDQAEQAVEPVARAAGVSVKRDVWVSEADPHRPVTDYYLEANDRGTVTGRAQLESYLTRLAKAPSFQVPFDHELGFEETDPGRWRSYYLHRAVVLDGSAVVKAEVDEDDHGPLVLADLSDAGAKTFGQLTSQIVGKKLAILSDDTVLSAPIINGEIRGGKFTISMAAGEEQAAERLVAKLERD